MVGVTSLGGVRKLTHGQKRMLRHKREGLATNLALAGIIIEGFRMARNSRSQNQPLWLRYLPTSAVRGGKFSHTCCGKYGMILK